MKKEKAKAIVYAASSGKRSLIILEPEKKKKISLYENISIHNRSQKKTND